MSRVITAVTLLALTLAAAAPTAGQTPKPAAAPPQETKGTAPDPAPEPTPCATATAAAIKVCYTDDRKWDVSKPPRRITNKENVTIEVVGFNFLKYALTFDVKEEESEAYQYLVKLWSSVIVPGLPLDILGRAAEFVPPDTPSPELKLLSAVRAVYAAAMKVEDTLRAVDTGFTTIGLTLAQRKTLHALLETLRTDHRTLGADYKKLQDLIATDTEVFQLAFGALAKYVTLGTQVYGAASDKATIALSAGARTVGGDTRSVGEKDAGLRVTVNLIAVDQAGGRSQFARAQYVVQTEMPLTAFVGIGVNGVSDVNFKTIQRAANLGEDDVFLQQGEGGTTVDFSLFLGWEAWQFGERAGGSPLGGVLISLGTEARQPGRTIMLGPSIVLYDRFVLGGGYAFGREEDGQLATQEPNLFRVIRTSTRHTWFWTLGMRVF